VTAGGPRMAGVWERLTGRPPSDPSSFLAALLTIDDGLLMYFFDAVRHASPSVQQAIAESALARPASIDEIYRPFRAAGGAWSLEARPFDRPARDPAWTFSLLDLPGGRIGGPAWLPHILERVSSGADWTDKPIAIPTKVPVGDIDWTTRWLFDRPGDQLDRVKLLRFAQRLNGLDRATPDTADAALRTFRDLPALALALERMGIDDVDTVARAGRAGYTLSRAADRRIVEPILARWQASFGLVEQAARLRHVPASVTRPLILALADAASRPAREVTDRILHWTTEVFLPAVAPGADALRLDRESLVRITSADRSARERVTWEGLNYDRSPLRVARRNLDALTATPTSASADAGVLERLHRQLDQGFRSSDDARKMATELDGMRRLERPSLTGPPSEGRFSKQLGVAARTLRADPPIAQGGTAPPPALEVSSVFGDAADDIVQPIVYALAMTPLHQTPALQVDAWTFHDLAAPEARDDWWRAAWQPATQQPRRGGGSGLVGSWLLLDLSLGEATVPRRFDRADSLATPVLDAIFREIALRAHPSDEQVDALGDAVRRLERGRVVLAQWQQSAPNGDDLARWDPRGVAIGATRRSALAWSLGHDVNAVGNLSVTEIAALGGPPRLAAMPIDGCVCVAAAPAWPLEDIRPYWMAGVPAAFATDLHLRVAELLTAAHLPLQLVADVLPLAAADWLSHVEPYANDDWEALTLWPKQLTLAEIEGYVMQLMADGILTPIDEAVP